MKEVQVAIVKNRMTRKGTFMECLLHSRNINNALYTCDLFPWFQMRKHMEAQKGEVLPKLHRLAHKWFNLD